VAIILGPRPRVLVVDDEPDIRELIATILDTTAVSHEEVGDGTAALDRLSSSDWGAVVLDLMMPGTDGLAVLGTLQAARPELLSRVIVLTGGTAELIGRIDQQVFRVLRKPFAPRELVETIRECLNQRPADAAARPHITRARQGGFIIDFGGSERWWVEGDVEPFRSEARGLAEEVPTGESAATIREMLLELESLGLAARVE
jgi:two-component system OmpR family response regulator